MKDVITTIFEPMLEYWSGIKRLNAPRTIVNYASVDKREFTKVLLGAILLATIADYLLPSDSPVQLTVFPFVNDILLLLLLLVGGIIGAALVHKPLKWGGGAGEFKDTLIASMYSSAICLPFIIFLEGLFKLVVKEAVPGNAVSMGAAVLFCNIIAPIHGLKPQKVYLIVFGVSMGLGLALVAILLFSLKSVGSESNGARW